MHFSTLIALVTFSTAPAVFTQVGTHCSTTSDGEFFQLALAILRNQLTPSTVDSKINGMVYTEQAYGVRILNGQGCGDWFDNKDFSGGCTNC
ncbi:hypothetical protein B0H10DRAFT_2224855 [Mycena sp. CBHHK59/15]|nr:hypothetical protein B0H10DRAFT_2224855 [Mycena sp. CBHHK59/15]